ncbi:hypothetical protein OIU91_40765 [Streptomyces sp. NBC_01456]|uniref:hypothetical protein n=1 Tax=Streptomyces sp. NBC_01454 TaxID=2975867 RepID=UPI002E35C995|nr:hypothetical protein [Streptomyces sp. NBC_01454]
MGEQRRRQEAGGGFLRARVAVVPEVRGEGCASHPSTSAWGVPAPAAGEFVPDGFVALSGLGLLQRAPIAQRLELIGAGGHALRFPCGGFVACGGCDVGGALVLDRSVGGRVVDAAGLGEQPDDALPLGEFGRAALVLSQILVAGVLPGEEVGVLQPGRRLRVRHPGGAAARRRTERRPTAAGSTGGRPACGVGADRGSRRGEMLTRRPRISCRNWRAAPVE